MTETDHTAAIRIDIPETPRRLIKILTDAGYPAYAVGGCVRDSILGIPPHDWDICTAALPEEMRTCFSDFRVIDTGIKHGTLTVMCGGEGYEITTFRLDGDYSDHRHPDSVQFTHKLHDDLKRRDFTINAMAADVHGNVIDCFGGIDDLNRGIIRCVGDPDERFSEDALRILRALRFASRFGFSIDEKTARSIHKNKDLLSDISAERIQSELSGILMGKDGGVLTDFRDVLAVFIPEIAPCFDFDQKNPHHDKTVWDHTVCAVYSAPYDLAVRLALLFHDLGKPACFTLKDGVGHFYGHADISAEIAASVLKRLKYDNRTLEDVTQLVKEHDCRIEPEKPSLRRSLGRLGEEQFFRLLEVKAADQAARSNLSDDTFSKEAVVRAAEELIEAQRQKAECFSLSDLEIDGNDLIAAGFRPGKAIGDCLEYLLAAVMDEKLENEKTALLKAADEFMARKSL